MSRSELKLRIGRFLKGMLPDRTARPNEESTNNGRRKKAVGYFVGLAVIALLVYLGGPRAIEATVRPRIGHLIGSFLANLLMLSTSSTRWGYIVNNMEGTRVCSYGRYFSFFISGRFLGQYVSRAGGDFLLRPGLLNRVEGVSLSKGMSASLLDKAFDLALIALLIIPSALQLLGIITESVAIGVAAALLAFLALLLLWKGSALVTALQSVLYRMLSLLRRIPLLRRIATEKRQGTIKNLDRLELLEGKSLLVILALTLMRYLTVISRLYLLVLALDLSIPLSVLLPGIIVAQSSLIFAFTPGALGILEGGWYMVLSAAGVPQVERTTFLIGQRVYWFIFTTVIFLVVYLASGARWLKKQRHTEGDSIAPKDR
jgi:uncharacterized protein (TIRG00374 family)